MTYRRSRLFRQVPVSFGGPKMTKPVQIRHMLSFTGAALFALAWGSAQAEQSALESVYEQKCGVCHNNPATRAPARASLHAMSPKFVVEALTNGIMKAQGAVLSTEQRVALAEFLTGQTLAAEV